MISIIETDEEDEIFKLELCSCKNCKDNVKIDKTWSKFKPKNNKEVINKIVYNKNE